MNLKQVNEAIAQWTAAFDATKDAESRREAKLMLMQLIQERRILIEQNMAVSAPNQMYHSGD